MIVERLGLDAGFMRRLERLALIARQRKQGYGAGPRRSPATGSSVEFSDFRTYAAGDDFRRVDWNAFARLDRLFMRVFEAEDNTTVTIFVDCSRSMEGGDPPKSRLARQLAASLVYIALANYDRVAVAGIGDRPLPYLAPRSGIQRAAEVWRFIADLPETAHAALDGLRLFEAYRPAPGLAIVISDMLTESDWRVGLRALQGVCRQEVTLVQILAPDELHPTLDGDLTLVDAETGARTELSITPAVLARYQAALAAYTGELSSWTRRQGIPFLQASSSVSIEDLVLRLLVSHGVAK
ncbi:MAG: hypothetical protein JWO42_3061 [Chloroflexi bacterium]|nr:hypothetical protein [Chloroflexota bacterium]